MSDSSFVDLCGEYALAFQAASPPDISEYSDGYESTSDDDRPTLNPDVLLDILSCLSSPDCGFRESEDDTSGIESDGASDADDERSSSDGYQSPFGINGSPRLSHEGKVIFEGNIWNEIAEADDGINEVNNGFCALIEQERIRLEEEYRCRDWLAGNEAHQDGETHE
ncbi:hypothetical protein FRC10_000777 [Ceratobasidium sp. 414]|nr:hypothetical protein FRC10_000777 [Ceratobasidium sp. 414]